MRRLLVAGAAIATAAGMASCGSDSTSPDDGGSGGSAFDIQISSGGTPTYTWPGGLGYSVSIVRTSAPGTIVWGVAHLAQALPSPVTHGVVPGGAVQTINTEPRLTAGVRYRVAITRADTKTGYKEFTP